MFMFFSMVFDAWCFLGFSRIFLATWVLLVIFLGFLGFSRQKFV